MDHVLYRKAVAEDAAECIAVRSQTRENAFTLEELHNYGVTPETIGSQISNSTICGYVCLNENQIVGYCFGAYATAEIIVLALLPDYENNGIGKTLLNMVLDEFRRSGAVQAFLGCSTDPTVRAYGFYRHLGWLGTGEHDDMGDEILVLAL